MVYKEIYFENFSVSEKKLIKILGNDIIQKLLNLLNISILVYNYYCVLDKNENIRISYWVQNFFLMLIINDNNCSIKKFLIKNVFLQNFGAYSYNIYLIHPPLINTIYKKYLKNTFSIPNTDEELILIIMISYFFGYIIFEKIEKPLIRYGHHICEKYFD